MDFVSRVLYRNPTQNPADNRLWNFNMSLHEDETDHEMERLTQMTEQDAQEVANKVFNKSLVNHKEVTVYLIRIAEVF